MKTVTILGATGSIGQNTLDVISRHPDLYRVFAVTGHSNVESLVRSAVLCNARFIVLSNESAYENVKQQMQQQHCHSEVLIGPEAMCEVCSAPEVDIVMSAIVGAAGLLPTIAAVRASKRVLLANKESLVMSGELFMNAVREHKAELLPIDSEHNAIFQCLPHNFEYGNLAASGISKILLTGSGGPFREKPLDEFELITPEQACAHPNWTMGRKISVDSASMMNKGLEFIEAKWLFGVDEADIQVVLHPQSTIHSMVQYSDGSVIAQMGNPDMRTPIAYGLSYPSRIESGVSPLDFSQLANFSFAEPDNLRYPNLYLAIEACKEGQSATTALNASNEVAVEAFLDQKLSFCAIAALNERVLSKLSTVELNSIAHVIEHDEMARNIARAELRKLS
ncbi:1-deoxy-D-xylulose-5-phosphate reductoisomerase [Glaciecola sp. MH2013]|uniref:1-deoxy-D-xylulose-5-phosphate reductoisomerase n=1 Tax=Glaciecola sp. MH2013 TaxID=2785524 RepID=UPI00189EDB6B|nr:1-deoxy-D-xylulose-5-phosphate reductoisomerase [Glaciecola sp. MH2013]MBF7072275.1 1-deoxy-D-xylulose-5-phosphate reductoisomerase [Glaciecola sp. MH2013]